MRTVILGAAAVLALAIGAAQPAAAVTPGDLDAGFGSAGLVTTAITEYGDDRANAVAVDGSGKTLVAGGSNGSFAVARYNTDGTLDTSFSGDGITTVSFGAGVEGAAHAVVYDHDADAIVLVGSVRPPFDLGGQSAGDIAVARLNDQGNLDTSFDGDGRLTVDLGDNDDAWDAAIQPDGKIVIVGGWVLRLTTSGALDTTFSTDGKASADFGAGIVGGGQDVAIDGAGMIVVAVTTWDAGNDSDFGLARFESDGDPDPTFGTGGTVVVDTGDDAEAAEVLLTGDGGIVLAGTRFTADVGDLALARFTASGVLDDGGDGPGGTGYGGGDGLAGVDVGGNDRAWAAVVGGGDAVTLAGTSDSTNAGQWALARFDSDGVLDTGGFGGGDGLVTTDFGTSTVDEALGAALQNDGRLVVAGASVVQTAWDFVPGDAIVARYTTDGALDSTFSGDGRAETRMGHAFGDVGNGVAVQGDGKIVVAGAGIDEAGADDEDTTLTRYLPDGELDTTFGTGGKVVADLSAVDGIDRATAVALQADGRIVVAGWVASGIERDVLVARFNADGTPDPSFSGDGRVTVNFGGMDFANDVAIQPDGAIVVVGEGGAGLVVARFTSSGADDTSFSTDGRFSDPVMHHGEGVTVQSTGQILVVGGGDGQVPGDVEDFVVARYERDGDPDLMFGAGTGSVKTDFGSSINIDQALDVTVQVDGRILVAGLTGRPDTPIADCGGEAGMNIAVARYLPGGGLDSSFSGDGRQTTDIAVDTPYAVTVQPDGAIAVAGRATSDLALTR